MRKYYVIALMSLIIMGISLSSCDNSSTKKESELLGLKLDPKNIKDIIVKMKGDSLITIEDINYLHYAILNTGDSSIGKSVGELIAKGRMLIRGERLAELDNVGNALLMKTAIDIRITNFEEIKDSSLYRVYVEFFNKSAETIRTNSGKMRFINMTGNYMMVPVEKLPLNLQPNQRTGNYFDIKDTLKMRVDRLANGNYKNLKSIDWLNTEIEFADGRRITVSQNLGNPETR